MTDEIHTHQHGKSNDLGFEREDLSSRSIYAFLISLAVSCVLIFLILWGFYYYLDAYWRQHQPPQNPLVEATNEDPRAITPADITRFPQPRLEADERTELNGFRMYEEKVLHSYGWVDPNAQVVHIPIERAMQLITQRGLPTRSQDEARHSQPQHETGQTNRRPRKERKP